MPMRERAYLTNHGHEAFGRAHELADPADEVFISQAREVAREMGNRYYGSEHLLLALVGPLKS